MEKLRKLGVTVAAAFSFAFVSAATAQDEPEAHYFAVVDTTSTYRTPQEFIIKLTDAKLIEQARLIAAGSAPREFRVEGAVLPGRTDYNELWTFYLDPTSIRFFDQSEEACDATPMYVEEHLVEMGSVFHWCPYSSRVIREVKM